MSIRNILVSFNGTETSTQAARFAVALVGRCDAHLSGVFAHTVPHTSLQMGTYVRQAALDIMAQTAHETEDQVTADFHETVLIEEQGVRASVSCQHGFPNEVLCRYGLDATVNVQPLGGVGTSDIILDTCAETDAGLLVTGAYEHSRFAEMILGGVTPDIVARSHIPALMPH